MNPILGSVVGCRSLGSRADNENYFAFTGRGPVSLPGELCGNQYLWRGRRTESL